MVTEILTKIAHHKETNYNLRYSTALQGRNIKTVMYDSKTASSLEPKIWDTLPTELKKSAYLILFKNQTRQWATKNCLCHLFKKYIENIEFL